MKFPIEPNYKPLRLPASGADLCEGRQYYIDPIARARLKERGLFPPRIVECISRRYFARRIETITTNLETDVVRVSVHTDEARAATFRYNAGRSKLECFTLDCEEVHELRGAAAMRGEGLEIGESPLKFHKHLHITKNNVKQEEIDEILEDL